MASEASSYAGRKGKIEKDREGREGERKKGEDELLAGQVNSIAQTFAALVSLLISMPVHNSVRLGDDPKIKFVSREADNC